MKLTELLKALPAKEIVAAGDLETEIKAVVYDSRHARKNSLFVAIPGLHTDGHKHIEGAVKHGAVAMVGSNSEKLKEFVASAHYENQTIVRVENERIALAGLAAALYEYPARELGVIGITGTDGKTTTSFLICGMLDIANLSNGLIGTVDYKIGSKRWPHGEHQTTPEAPEIQDLLRQMVKAKVEYAVLESTSHGLALHRVDNCAYDIAVFTNLTRDHLEFHGTLAGYRQAKGILFEALSQESPKPFIKLPQNRHYQPGRPQRALFCVAHNRSGGCQ